MLQLVYVSTATPGFDPAEVDAILAVSRKNNAIDRISGLLLFDGRRFMQALEGEPSLVERTYARIRLDPRHRAIVKLSERKIEAREFGDWAMAAQRFSMGDAGIAETVDRLVATVPHPSTRALFSGFARVRKAA